MTSGKMYIWAYTQYQLKKSAMKDSSSEQQTSQIDQEYVKLFQNRARRIYKNMMAN